MFDALPHRATVLLVDGSDHDASVVRNVFKRCGDRHRLHAVGTLAQARDFLYRRGAFARVQRPNLILLDVDHSDGSGLDLLAEIKSDRDLRPIPVIVISGTATDAEQQRAYDCFGAAYVRKPTDPDAFESVVESIEAFYLKIVKLPG